jgi:hypothetical protein
MLRHNVCAITVCIKALAQPVVPAQYIARPVATAIPVPLALIVNLQWLCAMCLNSACAPTAITILEVLPAKVFIFFKQR